MVCRCIIVEDDFVASKLLEHYINLIAQLELIGTCQTSMEALDLIFTRNVDLVFLDIHLPDLPGTEILKTLKEPPKVIFTTADDGLAIEAFELNAVDYLLKPVSFERFLKAVNKVLQARSYKKIKKAESGFIYFRADRKMIKVSLDEVLFFECLRDYIIIHLIQGKQLRVKLSLNQVSGMLPRKRFLRIHRSFIVSVDKITAFTKTDVEIGKTELPIGKSYTASFLNLIPHKGCLPEGTEERV